MDIFEAIHKRDLAKIKELFVKGVNPNLARSDGLKVLHVAAISHDIEVLELLLKQVCLPS
jgi:ankyrin repeat protein